MVSGAARTSVKSGSGSEEAGEGVSVAQGWMVQSLYGPLVPKCCNPLNYSSFSMLSTLPVVFDSTPCIKSERESQKLQQAQRKGFSVAALAPEQTRR